MTFITDEIPPIVDNDSFISTLTEYEKLTLLDRDAEEDDDDSKYRYVISQVKYELDVRLKIEKILEDSGMINVFGTHVRANRVQLIKVCPSKFWRHFS